MNIFIALLRGINVGGHKKMPMADLRALLSNSGLENVQTYIQSGNVVFQSSITDKFEIEALIKNSILSHFGFEVPALVKTHLQLQTTMDNCPFDEEKKIKSYFILLDSVPKKEDVKEATKKQYDGEEYLILNNCIYYYCEKGYGKAKFNMSYFERKLKVAATSRNYKTIIKLIELSSAN
ncbi:DUF1697 domain-containing protein [Winogradskyella sp. A2]|uniref:DUF1697 domain-containing protein n=1 Tax=Winogradskyella sp. A2 TaxID=3366944 RepID=UPI00398C3D0C